MNGKRAKTLKQQTENYFYIGDSGTLEGEKSNHVPFLSRLRT